MLVEVRQLRQALQNTNVVGQKTQVTLFRLQIQVLAVARATQRLDDVRSKLITAEFDRKREAGWVENLENLQKNTEDQKLRADQEVEIHQRKGELASKNHDHLRDGVRRNCRNCFFRPAGIAFGSAGYDSAESQAGQRAHPSRKTR